MKKAPSFAVVMGQSHGKDDDEDKDEGMSHEEHQGSLNDAAEEIFDALARHDKARFVEAFKAFAELQSEAPDEPSKDDDEPSEDEDEDEDEDEGLFGK